MSDAGGIAADQLRAFIERIERLEEEKKVIGDDASGHNCESCGWSGARCSPDGPASNATAQSWLTC